MTSSSNPKNARLLEPLRACSASFARIGKPPAFLKRVQEFMIEACGEAEYALQVNDRFGVVAFPTIHVHLRTAEEKLLLSRRKLAFELSEAN